MVDQQTAGSTTDSRNFKQILEKQVENAIRELRRSNGALVVSGLAAGMNVSFGALFMAMALTFMPEFGSDLAKQLTLASVSAVGFLLVMIGQTELFTAHTTMAWLPVLSGHADLRDLGRLWSIIYAANLVGCTVFAGLVSVLGPALGIVSPSSFGSLAEALLPFSWWTILLSGVVAGWLMGLATWLLAASRETVSGVLVVFVVTAGIGFGPFHHSLLGTTEVLGAMFLGTGVTLAQFGHFLLWTTLGNIVGGFVFVALLNYGQIYYGDTPDSVDVDPENIE
ncbi:formate/nitrite transporter family protein [Halomarina ordinaria]|uniref:Formate/nitrite transporter family protein n=1 Tax=Halomarina ordinaria TaxID=3033939 RepID=A0ABD5U5W3_9EURY|nr:formate/nitrite transporter family protein [Halomarina sp. PSRA2]